MKIPNQLYIVRQNNTGVQVPSAYPLAYMSAYEPTRAAFKKTQENQFKWAYASHYMINFKVIEEFGEMYVTGSKLDYHGGGFGSHREVQIKELITSPPEIVDNVPTAGFMVDTTVVRSSTSNKLWRIKDPRGFTLECTTEAFENIILNGTIIKGLIQEKCQWSGKSLVIAEDQS